MPIPSHPDMWGLRGALTELTAWCRRKLDAAGFFMVVYAGFKAEISVSRR